MRIIIDLLRLIAGVVLIIAVVPLTLAAVGYVGYFFGIIVSWLAGGILAEGLGMAPKFIPNVMAWLFVVGTVVGSAVRQQIKKVASE